jgi:GT2 family glycosyltransferase
LDALNECTYEPLSILVVDNGSIDGSIQRIRSAHPKALILEAAENLGFAGGNNIGMRHAIAHGAEYIWLLNNDTEPASNALSELVAKAMTIPRIGAVASICYFADDPSTVQVWAGASINLWIGYGRNTVEPHNDDWFDSLYGASMLVACTALDDVGLLDEGFFHYWEETEFCLRLRKNGWRLAAAPNSRILHKVAASTGGNPVILDRYSTTSSMRLLKLHSLTPRLSMFLLLTVRLARRLLMFQFSRFWSVWAGIQDYRLTCPVVPKIR